MNNKKTVRNFMSVLMNKFCFIWMLVVGGTTKIAAQSTVQNCMGAIPICQNSYTQNSSYLGSGSITELNGSNQGCLTTGEINSVWYIINTSTAGNIVFTITPSTPSDYDFAVWDITDKSCADVFGGLPPIRCNYASYINSTPGGLTGLSTTVPLPSYGAGGGSFSSAINAVAGQTFVILINNSGGSTGGYTINFNGSTSQIVDTNPPFLKSDTLEATCSGPTFMKVLLSENIICTSLVANGSDFTLSPSSSSIASVSSTSCSGGSSFTNLLQVNFTSPLSPGLYTLSVTNGTDGNTLLDNCGNAIPVGAAIQFEVQNALSANISTQFGCAGLPTGVINATSIGGTAPYEYKLNAGAYSNNNLFTGLVAGNYTIRVKDALGCTFDTLVTLLSGTPVTIDTLIVSNLICFGINTGSIQVNASGGTMPYTYALNTSGYTANNIFSNLAPGSYVVHVKDANGCITDQVAFISSPGKLSINTYSQTNAICGLANGSIQLAAFGGLPPLQYALNSGPFQASGNFSNLSAGTFTIHIKDVNNCTKDTIVQINQLGNVFITSLPVVQPTCTGTLGSITVNANGGVTPYSYSLNGGAFTTLNSFSMLSAGSYTVIVQDANACSAMSITSLTIPSSLYYASSTVVMPTCLQLGSISVTGAGGIAPFLYAINSSSYASTNTFINLVAGNYTLHVKDNNGCIRDTFISLTANLIPSIASVITTQPSCSFPTIGNILINPSGGNLPYTFSIDGTTFVNTPSFTTLPAGVYTVTVKDALGCTVTSSVTLSLINSIQFSTITPIPVGCNGTPLGSILASLTNGNTPYEYSLNGGPFQSSGSFSNLTGGLYTVTGKDASGCSITTLVSISSSALLSINSVSSTNSICINPASGSIQINGTGSAPPISYALNFSTTNTSGVFAPLSPGIYTVSIFDNNGCHIDSSITISSPPAMYYSYALVTTVPCYGGFGNISVLGAGGNPPYTYALNTGAYSGTSTWNGITAGTYTIHLQDINGCIYDTVVQMIQADPIWISSAMVVNASCSGLNDGSIQIFANGGTGTLTYAINGSAFSSMNTFINLGPGNYTIQIQDANACGKDTIITINNFSNFQYLSITKQSPSCYNTNNGSISFTVSGGQAPYQYAINATPFTVTNTFTNLSAGVYTLHAMDNSTCYRDSVITLTQPNVLTFSSMQITATSCYGGNSGSVIALGTGGTPPYLVKVDTSVYNASGVFTGLTAGVHTLTIKDANNCFKDSIIFIPQPQALSFTGVSIIPPGCLGTVGNITVTGNGGNSPYTYAINTGPFSSTNSFTNLPAALYTLHVRDNTNCLYDSVIQLTANPIIQITSILKSIMICPNSNAGFLTCSASSLHPPVFYSYNGSTPQTSGSFSGLSIGNYTLHVQDQLGCYIDTVVQIASSPPILITNIILQDPLCFASTNGSITLQAVGGQGNIAFAINSSVYTNFSTFTNLSSGTYTLHIRDSLLCYVDSVVTIQAPPPLQFASINLVSPNCSNAVDGEISISAMGGQAPYVYAINTSLFTTNNVFQNLFQGTYTVFIKDFNGCIHDTVVYLNGANYMNFTNIVLQDVLCKNGNDGSISLNVSGGISPFQFSINLISTGTNSFFTNLTAGLYSIHVMDSLGCEADTILQINEPSSAVHAILLNATNNLCRGDSSGSITLAGIGGIPSYTYSKNGILYQSSNFFNGLPAGMYPIHIKDINGCISDTLIPITEPDTSLQLFLQGIKDVSCIHVSDGKIWVNAKYGAPPLVYSLNGISMGSDTSYANLSPGFYIVEVRDALGCKSTGKFEVKPSDKRPYILIDSLTHNLCKGDEEGSIQWHATNTFPPYTYSFDGNNIGSSTKKNKLASGTYTIYVIDSIGCYADTLLTIEEGSSLDLTIETTPALCQGIGDDGKAIAITEGGVAPFTFAWSTQFGNTSNHADGLWYGNQTAYVTDSIGCTDSAQFTIDYDPCCIVNLPNAFSPNGDGNNDAFRLLRYGQIELISLEVYNRWGNCVFKTAELTDSWDGKYLGVDCDLGTYFYILRYKCHLHTERLMEKGDVTLIR